MGIKTSRLQLETPLLDGSDAPPDVPFWMNKLAVQLDGMITPTTHGALSTRPVSSSGTPGIADRQYWASDVDPATITDRAGVPGMMFRDNGTGWDPVGPFASKVSLGFFNMPTVAGNFDVTTVGFKPKAIDVSYGPSDDSDTYMSFGRGFATGPTNRFASYFRATAQGGGAYQRRTKFNRIIYIINFDGSVAADADFVSFLANGFRINFSNPPGSGNSCQWRAYG
jgi:hypothetical protein